MSKDSVLEAFGYAAHVRERQILVQIPDTTGHIPQNQFVRSKCKRKIARAGRRGGKTVGCSVIAAECFLAGRRVLYATPTSDQFQKFWNEILKMFADAIQHNVFKLDRVEHSLSLPGLTHGNEQRIRAKTAWNADTLRGDYADVLLLDEYQLMNEDAWGVVGAPMLIDNDGDAVFIYTPPSLHSRSASKATDRRHASKLYKEAENHVMRAQSLGQESEWGVFHWTSFDNPYVSRSGLENVSRDMTQLAQRQEMMAEDIDEIPGALWTRRTLEKNRVIDAPTNLIEVVVAVDPPGGSAECGIVVVASAMCNCRGEEEVHGFVLEDATPKAGTSPALWASKVVEMYWKWDADWVVGETNFGGPMVEHTVKTADKRVGYFPVRASRGKAARAEPVAAQDEQGKIHHVGQNFIELEEELCSWAPISGAKSPNRLDARVWGCVKVMPNLLTPGLSFA